MDIIIDDEKNYFLCFLIMLHSYIVNCPLTNLFHVLFRVESAFILIFILWMDSDKNKAPWNVMTGKAFEEYLVDSLGI